MKSDVESVKYRYKPIAGVIQGAKEAVLLYNLRWRHCTRVATYEAKDNVKLPD